MRFDTFNNSHCLVLAEVFAIVILIVRHANGQGRTSLAFKENEKEQGRTIEW
jgi:hypothetical protein